MLPGVGVEDPRDRLEGTLVHYGFLGEDTGLGILRAVSVRSWLPD